MAQLDYRSVKDLYDNLHDAGVVKESLPEWALRRNAESGTDFYSAGLHDNIIKRASVGIDRLLEATGLPNYAESLGRSVGEAVGAPETGASIGRGLPRMAVNVAPLLAAAALPPLEIPALIGMAGLSGAETYTATDSPAAGIVSGVTAGVMPGVAHAAEQQVLRRVGAKLVEGPIADALGNVLPGAAGRVSRYIPETIPQGLAGTIAGQVAAGATAEAGSATQAAFDPNAEYHFSPVDAALNLTLGQLPFAGAYLTKRGRAGFGGEVSRALIASQEADIASSRNRIELRKMQETLSKAAPIEGIPNVGPTEATPEVVAALNETKDRLSVLRGEQLKVKNSDLPPEEKVVQLQRILDEERDTLLGKQQDLVTPNSVFGDSISEQTPRTQVIGKVLKENKDGTWRAILVHDAPVNPEELRGKVVKYSTYKEPNPTVRGDGTTVFGLPPEQWRTVVTADDWVGRFRKFDPTTQPELPVQGQPATDEELFGHLRELDQVSSDADNAQTGADMQQAVVRLNNVKAENDLPPTGDTDLKKTADALYESGQVSNPDDAAKRAIKVEAARTARRLEARQEMLSQRTEDIAAGQEHRAKLETSTDEQAQTDLQQLKGLEQNLISRRSKYADQLLGGDLNRIHMQWVEAGKPGGFETFAKNISDVVAGRRPQQEGVDYRLLRTDTPTLDEVGKAAKADPIEGAPAQGLIAETAARVVQSDAGQTAFEGWSRKGETNLRAEQRMFNTLTDEFGTLKDVNVDDAAQYIVDNDTLGKGLSLPEAKDEVQDFLTRPHVQVWNQQMESELARMRQKNAAPQPLDRSAGDRWLFSMGPYDPETNTLNGKHRLPRNGEIREATFRNMAGVGKPLTEAELQLYHQLVPEAFDGQGNVNVPKLDQGLKEKGPVVETKSLQQNPNGGEEKAQRRNELLHELETAGFHPDAAYNDAVEEFTGEWELPPDQVRRMTPETRRAWDELQTLTAPDSDRGDYPGQSRYAFLGPKPESEMPGYVEGLVRMPQGEGVKQPAGVTLKPTPRYRGPHFGSEDTNVFAFYRGYVETLPDGTKAFHVIEVQSDWGQTVRKEHPRGGAKLVPDHPLLRVYESLALKAAIQHAKEIGATKVILSDAETAMMTEGHDRAAVRQYTMDRQAPKEVVERIANELYREKYQIDAGLKLNNDGGLEAKNGELAFPAILDEQGRVTNTSQAPQYQFRQELFDRVRDTIGAKETTVGKVSQEAGMRLHYDQILPSAMEKLTGVKGERVEVGTHKMANAFAQDTGSQRADDIVGSPVFKDEAGVPKTQITGRLYDISNTPDAFTLTDRARAAERPYVPQPEDAPKIAELGVDRGGEGLRQYALKSSDPIIRAVAQDLGKFTDALARTRVRLVEDGDTIAYARNIGDRQAEVVLDSSLFDTGRAFIDYTALHELVHAVTMTELNNPTNAIHKDALNKLRQQLIDTLPKDMRTAYDKAVKTKWYENYGEGKVKFDTLFPDNRRAQILYGLLDEHEFVAQGLSDPIMREFMRNKPIIPVVRVGRGPVRIGSLFTTFTNTIKALLGIGDSVNQTAFEHFLSHTSGLLKQSDSVASFANFSDRYFEGLGLSKQTATAQTRRALGLVTDPSQSSTPEAMFATLQQSPMIRSPDLIRAAREFTGMLHEKGDDFARFSSVMDDLGHDVGLRGLDDYVFESLANARDLDALDLLPESAAKYVFEQVKDMHQVIGALHAAGQEANAKMTNIVDPKRVGAVAKEAYKQLEKILDVNAIHDQAVKDIQGLFAMTPDGFADSVIASAQPRPAAGPASVGHDILEEGEPKDKLGRIQWWLKQPAQWARSNPFTAELIDRGYELQKNAREMFGNVVKIMGMDLDAPGQTLTKAGLDESVKAINSPRTLNAVNKWMFWNNEVARREKRGVTVLAPDHEEVAKVLNGLSDAERKSVGDVIAKLSGMTQVGQKEILNKMANIAAVRGAKILLRGGIPKTGDAVTLSNTLFEAMFADRTDPVAAQVADGKIMQVQQKTDPVVFNSLLGFAQGELEKYNLWKNYFTANPAWATAQRQERWLVEYRRNGKLVQDQGSSKKEVLERAKGATITKEPWDQWKQRGDDEFPNLGPDSDAIFNRIKEIEDNQLNALKRSPNFGTDEEAAFRKMSVADQLAREGAVSAGGIPDFKAPPRGLTKGADELPWLWNHIAWHQRATTYWTRQLFRAQADTHLADADFQSNPDFRKALQTHVDNILQPDPNAIRKINKFVTVWNMGLAPASAMINGFQTLTSLIPELTQITNHPLESYRTWKNAVAEVIRSGGKDKTWNSDEHKDLMDQAVKAGEVDYSMWDPDAGTQDAIATNWKRAMLKQKPQTLGQRLDTMSGGATTAGLWLFKQVEKFNSRVSLLAAYDTMRDQGLEHDAAVKEAFRINHAVNFGGGRANRPIGIYSGRGDFSRSVALLGTNLQNYNLGVVGQLTRYLQQGFFRPEGLKPSEVWAARKAATQMLGTQFALAGTLGLPFVSSMIAVLNQAFPSLEINRHIRQFFGQLQNEDEENGSTLGDIALTGLPSMLGWDMQSRLSMGNILPGVSEYNGFQPQAMFGPPANTMWSFVNGARRVVTGDPAGGMAFVPPGIRKLFQLVGEGGKVNDYRDRPMFTPSAGESVGLALGFQPKRLSDFNSASRMSDQLTQVTNRREGQFHQQQAEDVLKGNFGNVRQSLLQRAQSDKSYNPAEGVRSVARAAEELTFPRDLRREGTTAAGANRSQLLSSFNLDPSQPTEEKRTLFRQMIQQRLGLPVQGAQELIQAKEMDQLRLQHPNATRAELRRMIALGSGHGQQTLGEVSGFQEPFVLPHP